MYSICNLLVCNLPFLLLQGRMALLIVRSIKYKSINQPLHAIKALNKVRKKVSDTVATNHSAGVTTKCTAK